jgi:TetR/AcrR family transcriptional repressor of mexJK operon
MKLEVNIKQDQIIATALRRFSHFGISKSTLTEIADDLTISKQALAHYFPDKQSLVDAVIEKLTEEYTSRLKKEIEQSPSVSEALLKLTQVKGIFFEKYFMLLANTWQPDLIHNKSYQSWRTSLVEKESGLLVRLFEQGVLMGELRPLNAAKTAQLLIDTISAFSQCVKDKAGLPGPEVFHEVLGKQKEVIKLFYEGLNAGRKVISDDK